MKFKISTKKCKIVKLKFKDSRHAQLSIYAVFHKESYFHRIRLPCTEKISPRVFGCLFIKFEDFRHAQLSIYAVFDEESDVQVKNEQISEREGNK